MLKKIKEYIKNLDFKKRYKLLSTIKNLLISTIVLIDIYVLTEILFVVRNITNYPMLNLAIFFILMCLFIIISVCISDKLSTYFKSFDTEEEIINNIEYYYETNNGTVSNCFIKLYNEKEDKILERLRRVTEKTETDWILKIKVNVRKLLLSKDLKWYSKQVSTKDLYNYCKNTINEIIENEEKEYYQIILEIFEDFIEEEKLNKIKDKLVKENTISIINI